MGFTPPSARPPTPPKESCARLSNANGAELHSAIVHRPLVDTPEESPSSSAEYFKGSSEKAQKRVGFSPWTKFHTLAEPGSRDSDSESSIRRLPPSKECKSLKSILKACTNNITLASDTEMLVFDQTNFPAMLRSTIQHLANPSRASRLDAYSTLFACLSAYDEVPETNDLAERVVEIAGCIRQDIAAKINVDGTLDTQLVTQALKVLTVFLCTPKLSTLLPEDFCSFIIDRSISSVEDAGSPKILVTHYMHLLEKQKFTSKIMTTDRANRLLSALDMVTVRTKGNRVTCHRLMIYQRLLLQSKSVMAARLGSWIDNLVSGMLSSIKEIRVRAIGFGIEAGLQLGTMTSVSQACVEFFNRANPEGKKVIEFLCDRLGDMIANKEDGVYAPQIWSIVILFFRSRQRQLECWEHMKAWLIVIQRCLNCSDPQVKFQANLAWSRLIFVISPDASTSNSMTKMLRQPLVSQLERKANDKNSKQAKQIARSTYCTLLYYAFRPTAAHAQLDQYWDLYVAQILPISFAGSKSDVNHALDILTALLSSNGKPKVWDENRATMNGPVKPDELPCLDAKWIRARAEKIAQIFDIFFDLADWRFGEDREAPMLLAWRSFMTALGIASSKEVKVSMGAMNAVATVTNQIKRLLDQSTHKFQGSHGLWPETFSKGNEEERYLKISTLLREAVAKIGTIPFLERRLILTSQDAFEAAETPSSRSSRDPDSVNSPAMHLLKLLLKSLPNQQPSLDYINTIKVVMHITLLSANNRRTQLVALRNHARLISPREASVEGAQLILWQLIAEAAFLAIKMPQQSEIHNASPQPPGQEYRDAVKILELGIHQRSMKTVDAWQKLHDCIADSLRQEICDDGITLMMTEPLAEALRRHDDACDEALLIPATMLLHNTHWPRAYQSTQRAQKLLWGISHTPHIPNPIKSILSLYSMVDTLLGNAYGRMMTMSADAMESFLSAMTRVTGSCPVEHQTSILNLTHRGLATWVEDAGALLSSSCSSLLTGVFHGVSNLWSAFLTFVERCVSHDTKLLFSIQHLFLSGLKSRHRSIINHTILVWNRTFGCSETLDYPPELRAILLKLQLMTDIQLPTFPSAGEDEAVVTTNTPQEDAFAKISKALSSSPIHFRDSENEDAQSQDLKVTRIPDQNIPKTSDRLSSKASQRLLLGPSHAKSPHSIEKGTKTTPKASLRHNDSQVQFAAIDSSPLAPEAADSQVLTARQKEVKERQGIEAAMFPEIRSSPKSASRPAEYSLPKLVFIPNPAQVSKPAVDEQISPIYPPDILMNDFLGSSPTPASSKKGTGGIRVIDGPPSSPPFISSIMKVNDQATLSSPLDSQMSPITKAQPADQPRNSHEPESKRLSDTVSDSNEIDETAHDIDQLHNSKVPAAAPIQPEDRIMSDIDVFVDAPAEPTEIVPAIVQNNDISTVFTSFPAEARSDLASEEDPVTAQLIGEMERASSQFSNDPYNADKPVSNATNKRRNPFSEYAHAQKRPRGLPNSLDPPQQGQITAAGQAVAEYVLIDVRPAQGPLSEKPVQVKRERSESPTIFAKLQPTGLLPIARKRRGRLTGKSRPGQLSRDASSNSSSPYQSQAAQELDINDALIVDQSQHSARASVRRSDAITGTPSGTVKPAVNNNISESDSITKSGKRKASRFWYYTTDEPNVDAGASREGPVNYEDNAVVALRQHRPSKPRTSKHQQQMPGKHSTIDSDAHDRASISYQAKEASQSESAAGPGLLKDAPTAKGIVQGFKNMLSSLKQVALSREDEREISKVLFQSMAEVHEAGRRHTAT